MNIALSDGVSGLLFASHAAYQLPCDTGCNNSHRYVAKLLDTCYFDDDANDGQLRSDVVHRFALQRAVAWPLNEKLTKLALAKERLASIAKMSGVSSRDVGVQKTNNGGYQSHPDLFKPHANPVTHESLRCAPAA